METKNTKNRKLVNKTAKIQIKSELLTKKKALEMAPVYIAGTPEREKYTDNEIKNSKTLFNLNGMLPHIFDCINGICTYRKDLIINRTEDNLDYYFVEMDIKDFYYYALGENGKRYKHDLQKEIVKIGNIGEYTTMFYNDKSFFICKPIIFPKIEFTKPTSKQNAVAGKVTSKITIQFLKDIWRPVVIDDKGHAFLYTPFALSSVMKYTINKYPILKIREHKAYRRLLLYLLLFDYSSKSNIIFDPIEMAYYCNNHLLRTDKCFRRKEAYQFVEKGLYLFQKMQDEGFLDGLKIKRGDFFTILRDNKFKITLLEPVNSPWKRKDKRLQYA